MSNLLEIQNLSVSFDTPAGEVQAVRDVSLTLPEGKVLALVGESGCGKSVLCRSVMKLLPRTAKIKSGSIIADGKLIGIDFELKQDRTEDNGLGCDQFFC